MKKYIFMLTMTGLGLSVIAGQPVKKSASTSYKVSPAASTFKWHATKVTGQHDGTVKYNSGTILFMGNTLTGGEVIMDMTTIDNTDLTGEYHDKLVGHLKSEEFFSVDKHKTATIKVKSATAISGAAIGTNNYSIVADMTIKGITKEITFPAMVIISKGQAIVNADFDIDRTDYDVRYGSGKFFEGLGDKAIMDMFNIKVRIVAKK